MPKVTCHHHLKWGECAIYAAISMTETSDDLIGHAPGSTPIAAHGGQHHRVFGAKRAESGCAHPVDDVAVFAGFKRAVAADAAVGRAAEPE